MKFSTILSLHTTIHIKKLFVYFTLKDSMHREYRKLCRWYQGNDACKSEDIENAKERLRNIKENMKSIKSRIERIER